MLTATSICSWRFAIARTRSISNESGKFRDDAPADGAGRCAQERRRRVVRRRRGRGSRSLPREHGRRPNALYRNDAGKFTDAAAEPAGWSPGAAGTPNEAANGTVRPCAADVDGDGRFDLFTANYGPNGLFLIRGVRMSP